MITLFILKRLIIWVLGFYKMKALGALMSSLVFYSLYFGQIIMLLCFFV